MDATVLYVRSGSGRRAPPDGEGLSIAEVTTAAAARDAVAAGTVDAVVVEVDECGLDPVAAVRAADSPVPILACSGTAAGDLAARATRRGADEYYPREDAEPALSDRVRAHLGDETGSASAAGNGSGKPAITEVTDGRRDGPLVDGASEEPLLPRLGAGDVENPVELYVETLELADDGVYALDEEGRFEFVNPGMVELTGYGREELLGAPADLIIHEDDADEAREVVYELAESEERETTFKFDLVPREGEPFPCEDRVVALTDGDGELTGTVGVIRDVTDRKERERTLERYREALEAVDDGVYVLDDEGCFEFVNGAMTELTGYGREELHGEHTEIIKDDRTVARAEQTLWELLAGEDSETTFELQLQPRSGEAFPCEDHMAMLTDEDGRFTGTAGIIRDITDRKRREERLSRLLETSQTLVAARDREAIARVVAEEMADALGHDRSIVRLYDEERDALVPTARGSDDAAVVDRPAYAAGEDGPGRAFERGETLRLGGETAPDEPVSEVGDPTDAVHIPLGEHGVVTLETTDPVGFEEATVSMAEVLASIAAVALERADREQDLLRYRAVIENVQDMVYVRDTAGRFSLVTDPLADWLGRDREALVGAALADLLPASEVPAVEGVVDRLREEGDSDASERVETEFVGADGQAWPAELEVSLFPSDGAFAGTVGVVRDRSELAETRELLETERDRFSYLFDNLPDAVVESKLDDDDRPVVRTVNDAFTEVFGYDAEEVVGDSINEHVLPEGEHEAGRELDRRTAAGERPRCEVRRRTANGLREFLLRGIPYETGDGTIRSFGIYTDITARKQRERRLEVLNRVLRHNIRNDVNVILGHAEVLADRVEDDDFATRAAELREKAAELTALSDRARSLDRTMRRGSPRDSIVGLATLVDDVVAGYDREYSALTVETAVADVRVVGDGRLALAVEELLDNVVEHAGAGSTVRVESERAGEDIRLRVADDGPGIPDHERSAVGGSTEITQLEHGSGLGLWVVRWVCESCGGRLRFEESDLGGAAVVLSLTGADG